MHKITNDLPHQSYRKRARGPREIKFIFVYFYTMYLEDIMFPLVPLLSLLYLLPESF